jgi:N6-L-threonylcarbamoyladenine synthase/protein kinase Bud32
MKKIPEISFEAFFRIPPGEMLENGAEAIVYLEEGPEGKKVLVKERIPKVYRHKEIDEIIRKERNRNEAKLMSEARSCGIPTPIIYDVEDFKLKMQYIEGVPIKYLINPEISKNVGKLIGKLHSSGIVHGDLTTSNLMLAGKKLYLLDFGLAYFDKGLEARGVDVHVLFQTFESTHSDHIVLIEAFKKGYQSTFIDSEDVLKRVGEIKKRARYA